MTVSSKRAEYIALASVIFSFVFFFIALFLGRWSGFFAVSAVSWLILSAALVWLVLVIQFHQRALAEQEKLDTGQLAQGRDSSTIFQAEGEQKVFFTIAQRRLSIFEKWFLPIFSAAIAIYEIFIGQYLLRTAMAGEFAEPKQPLLCAVGMATIAFVSFLLSRYATGMSAQLEWKPLRAGGGLLFGIAVVCFASAVSLALAQFKFTIILTIIGFFVPVLLIFLGAETALNIVLDIYRPRLKDQYGRCAFDSRLLGIINQPGEILHTAASAIDYQFGFKVSQTWFYKMLEKAIAPLIIFGGVTLYSLSCVVVVAPNEQAIIEHLGNPFDDNGQVKLIEPGLAFKWPWPIDIAYKYPTKKVSEISIGFVPKVYKEGQKRDALLWGKSHHEEEDVFLVASRGTSDDLAEGAVPVSLVIASVPVQYRIRDLYAFIYNHEDSEKMLESICYRELTKLAASASIEVGDLPEASGDSNQSLLGAGRVSARKILTDRIQTAADKAGLGVEIIFLGLQGIHPPVDVAADYQKVVGAIQKKQALILDAYAKRNSILCSLAGSVEKANELYDLAAQYQLAEKDNDTANLEKLGADLDSAFARASGEIFTTLREAQGYAFEKATLAEATGKRFADQLKAYQASPEIYLRNQRLAVFEESLSKIRKYIVVADEKDTQVFIVDVKEKLTPTLYDMAGFEESSEK